MDLRVGDWVQVRSKQEILATLDSSGRLQGLPFMPQMFKYCGQSFKVFKVAHKTCDTINRTGGRRLAGGIYLDIRCDGQAYGGCQAACLIFWKDAWLKPVSDGSDVAGSAPASRSRAATPTHGCLESDVLQATSIASDHEEAYQCQAVRLPYFTKSVRLVAARPILMSLTTSQAMPVFRKILSGLVYLVYSEGNQGLQTDPWASWPLVVRLVSNSPGRNSLPSASRSSPAWRSCAYRQSQLPTWRTRANKIL